MGKNCCKNCLGFLMLCCFSFFMVSTFVGLGEIYTGCYIPEQDITPVYQTNSTIPLPGTGIKGFGSGPINLALKAVGFPREKQLCPRWNHYVSPIIEIDVKTKKEEKKNKEIITYDHYVKTTRCTILFEDEKYPELDEFYSIGRYLQIVRNNPEDGIGVGQYDNCIEYKEALGSIKNGFGFIFSLIPISCAFVITSIMYDFEADKGYYLWIPIYTGIIGFPFALLYLIGRETFKITEKFVEYMTVYYNEVRSYIQGIYNRIWTQYNNNYTRTRTNPHVELVPIAIVPGRDDVVGECAICFGESSPQNIIRALCAEYHRINPDSSGHSCHNTYWHLECFATSLNHRSSCPNCRRDINRANMDPAWLNVIV